MTLPTPPRRGRAALAALLLAGTALGGYAAGQVGQAATVTEMQGQPVNPPGSITPHAVPDFTDLVTKVKPAVVSITTRMSAEAAEEEGGSGRAPMPFGQFPGGGRQRAVEARGSGFIVDGDGTVVTNNHVVKGATKVTVTLDDGTQFPAKVVGRDPRTDVAVLHVDAKHKLPFIELGDSAQVKPGEWVVAMGNPFGLGGTVTAGIVSALGRDIGAGPYDQFIQIDAPINQGNSGGPLFTQDGKVVGINTAILSPTGGSVGIGFAIPANTVRTVVAELEKTGHVTRGYIGVEVQPVNEGMAKALRLSGDNGALVAGVAADGPAAKAGLQPGDVINAVNGQTVANARQLAVSIASVKPGEEAKLDVIRDGEKKTVTAVVSEQPGNTQTAERGDVQGEGRGRIGVALAPISTEARDQLDLPDGTKGAVVAQVQPGSAAEQAGVRPGDVIVGVGSKAVGSPDEAVKAIRGAMGGKDKAVALRVLRNGQSAFIAVNPSGAGESQG